MKDLNLKIISNQATPKKIELDREKLIINLCKKISLGFEIYFYFETIGSPFEVGTEPYTMSVI